jgi:hypothetical protein
MSLSKTSSVLVGLFALSTASPILKWHTNYPILKRQDNNTNTGSEICVNADLSSVEGLVVVSARYSTLGN